MTPHGFVNLLKPPGLTSHAAVNRVRRLLGTKAVGHAGTLDPAASGVLPLAVGKATRLLEYLVSQSKVYTAEATFGIATDTLDQEGQVLWQAQQAPQITQVQLEDVLCSLIGTSEQAPPAYSAVKHQGRPLYEYARAGKIIEVEARPITIHSLAIKAYQAEPWPRLLFQISCSKGTYIRSLVQELAERMGTKATLTFLLREQVGDFFIQDSITLEELESLELTAGRADCLLPVSVAVRGWQEVRLDLISTQRFLQGQRLRLDQSLSEGKIAVYYDTDLLGIANFKQGILSPHKVLGRWEELLADDQHTESE